MKNAIGTRSSRQMVGNSEMLRNRCSSFSVAGMRHAHDLVYIIGLVQWIFSCLLSRVQGERDRLVTFSWLLEIGFG